MQGAQPNLATDPFPAGIMVSQPRGLLCAAGSHEGVIKQEGGSEAPTQETAGKGGCGATAMGARTPGEGEGAVRGGL